jgi:hypothetical protein
MRKRYQVLAFSVLLALAAAVPAIGQSSDPKAVGSAVTLEKANTRAKKALKRSKKALRKAKKANKKAKNALAQQAAFSYTANAVGAQETLFEGADLRIEASCPAAGNLEVDARSLADGAMIHVATIDLENSGTGDRSSYGEDDTFNTNQVEALDVSNIDDSVQGTFTFRNAAGMTVTGTYLLEEGALGFNCVASGNLEILEPEIVGP